MAYKLKERGGVYYVHFTDPAGERKRLSTGETDKERAAVKARDIFRQALLATPEIDPAAPTAVPLPSARRHTLADAMRMTWDIRWRHQRSASRTRFTVEDVCEKFGYVTLDRATYLFFLEVGRKLEANGDAPATRNRKLSLMATAMREAHKVGWIPSVPPFPHYTENNTRERYLTEDEEDQLLGWFAHNVAPANESMQYMRHLTTFLLDSGMRLSEALGIRPENDKGKLVDLKHGRTKNGLGRVVPLTERAREALDAMLRSPYHGKVNHVWCGQRFRRAVTGAKLKDVTLHTLRHTCASRLVQNGMDLYRVSKLLGHTSTRMTQRYAKLAVENLGECADMLEEIARKRAEKKRKDEAIEKAGRTPGIGTDGTDRPTLQ